nr:ORF1 [Torque teno felis virus]
MVYYRRRWRWKRRPRRYFRRRFWRKPRRWTRRRTVRRRRFKRKNKRVATFWQPSNRVRCKITGWTIGVNACTTPTRDTTNRVYKTWIDPGTGSSVLSYEGGGVNCLIFSLQFLWEEYRLFHNTWSETNDGHDLARYFGTYFYLSPHRYIDYIFWWDREFQKYSNENFIKTHPANLFGWKTKVFVRSQQYGNNHKTKRVFIKPPAPLLNTWKHMQDWFYVPLFTWGITVINWNKFFTQGKLIPYTPLPNVYTADWKWADGNTVWSTKKTCYYNSYYDTGEGNMIRVNLATSAQDSPPTTDWKIVEWANDLPYWMSFFGQNKTWDMGAYTKKQLISNTVAGYYYLWFKIKYPEYLTWQDSNLPIDPQKEKWICWQFKGQTEMVDFNAPTINHGISWTGPFVVSDNSDFIQIPVLYKSLWQWGGQTWSNMEIINPGHFAKNQVTVKNPALVARAVIHPWDTNSAGLLTEQALARIIQPSTEVEDRRREPGAEQLAHDAHESAWSEEETEESETDTEDPGEETTAFRYLKRRLLREQSKRRKLFGVLRQLVTHRGQTWEGAKPPPPQRGPPHPHY